MPLKKGFAVIDPKRHKEIARSGGLASWLSGKAHRWTAEEAREAGKKGGAKSVLARKNKKLSTTQPEAKWCIIYSRFFERIHMCEKIPDGHARCLTCASVFPRQWFKQGYAINRGGVKTFCSTKCSVSYDAALSQQVLGKPHQGINGVTIRGIPIGLWLWYSTPYCSSGWYCVSKSIQQRKKWKLSVAIGKSAVDFSSNKRPFGFTDTFFARSGAKKYINVKTPCQHLKSTIQDVTPPHILCKCHHCHKLFYYIIV